MSDPGTLHDFAVELLALAEACLATGTGGVPDRSYVSTALPALDCCPQLTVHTAGIAFDSVAPQAPPTITAHAMQLGTVFVATLQITIVRCTPQPDGLTGAPPDPAELEAVAAVVNEDGWLLWNCVANAMREGSLFEGQCLGIYLDNAVPVTDAGGCAGWVIQVRPRIQGFPGTVS